MILLGFPLFWRQFCFYGVLESRFTICPLRPPRWPFYTPILKLTWLHITTNKKIKDRFFLFHACPWLGWGVCGGLGAYHHGMLKVYPGLPAWSVNKVSTKSPTTSKKSQNSKTSNIDVLRDFRPFLALPAWLCLFLEDFGARGSGDSCICGYLLYKGARS